MSAWYHCASVHPTLFMQLCWTIRFNPCGLPIYTVDDRLAYALNNVRRRNNAAESASIETNDRSQPHCVKQQGLMASPPVPHFDSNILNAFDNERPPPTSDRYRALVRDCITGVNGAWAARGRPAGGRSGPRAARRVQVRGGDRDRTQRTRNDFL